MSETHCSITSHADNKKLSVCLSIDKNDRIVVLSAECEGDTDGILEKLCDVITGLPLVEAADHGILHVIRQRRQQGGFSHIKGIVTPQAAGPSYVQAQRLVRMILSDYRAKNDFSRRRSSWVQPLTDEWESLDDKEKKDRITSLIRGYLSKEGLSENALKFGVLETQRRFTVEFGEGIADDVQPSFLLSMEKWMRKKISVQLEVFVQEMKDMNKIRRL